MLTSFTSPGDKRLSQHEVSWGLRLLTTFKVGNIVGAGSGSVIGK